MNGRCGLLFAVLALWLGNASAALMIAVDMDPGTAGIQSSRSVSLGSTFGIEVLLDTDGQDVWAFEFDLYPGNVAGLAVRATSIAVSPVFGSGAGETDITVETLDKGAGQASAAASALLGSPVNGTGLVLAELDFLAATTGTIAIQLLNYFVYDFGGDPFGSVDAMHGSATVSDVPVPPSALILLPGVLVLGLRRRGAAGRPPAVRSLSGPGTGRL
jgi:hypothetical protein